MVYFSLFWAFSKIDIFNFGLFFSFYINWHFVVVFYFQDLKIAIFNFGGFFCFWRIHLFYSKIFWVLFLRFLDSSFRCVLFLLDFKKIAFLMRFCGRFIWVFLVYFSIFVLFLWFFFVFFVFRFSKTDAFFCVFQGVFLFAIFFSFSFLWCIFSFLLCVLNTFEGEDGVEIC